MPDILSNTRCERAKYIELRDWKRVRLLDSEIERLAACALCLAVEGETCHTLEDWPMPCEPHLVRQKAFDRMGIGA